jgi:hypothetical protein
MAVCDCPHQPPACCQQQTSGVQVHVTGRRGLPDVGRVTIPNSNSPFRQNPKGLLLFRGKPLLQQGFAKNKDKLNITLKPQKAQLTFSEQFKVECIEGSAISESVFNAAIDFIEDTGLWECHEALNLEVRREWKTRKPHNFDTLAVFRNEDGTIWHSKAKNPFIDFDGRARRYQARRGNGSRLFLPAVPVGTWIRIAERHGLEESLPDWVRNASPDAQSSGIGGFSFWDWVRQTNCPIVITEGGKKSMALLTLGYAAVAVYGINAGYGVRIDGTECAPFLIPDLKRFTATPRQFTIAFDQDTNNGTRRKVFAAQMKMGRLLDAEKGAVKITRWEPDLGKGIDDAIANIGGAAVETIISSAAPLTKVSIKGRLKGRLSVERVTNRIDSLDFASATKCLDLPDHGIVGLVGAKGTGKTEAQNELLKNESKVMSITFRIGLGRTLSMKLDLIYVDDCSRVNGRLMGPDGYADRIALCINSVLKVKPEDIEGGTLNLDEVEQVLKHLVCSKTCQKERANIIRQLTALCQAARKIVVADADLSDRALDFLAEISGKPITAIVHNKAARKGFAVDRIVSTSRSAIDALLFEALENGERCLAHVDDKGETLLEALVRRFPSKKFLLINSLTINTKEVQEFLRNPENSSYDAVIASPSLGTGWSLVAPIFDRVFGIFSGNSIGPDDMAQALSRCRLPVPRTVWCVEKGRNYHPKFSSSSPTRIVKELRENLSENFQQLHELNGDLNVATAQMDYGHPALKLWAQYIGDRNVVQANLGLELDIRLENEGNIITRVGTLPSLPAKESMAIARVVVEDRRQTQTVEAPIVEIDVAREMAESNLSPADALIVERAEIVDFLCIEPSLLTSGDVGTFDSAKRSAVQKLERTLSPGLAESFDRKSLADHGTETIITPFDLKTTTAETKMRELLGLKDLVLGNGTWTEESLKEAGFGRAVRQNAQHIKRTLGVTVSKKASLCEIMGRLVSQLGLKTEQVGKTHSGKRTYGFEQENYEKVMSLTGRRAKRFGWADSAPPHRILLRETIGGGGAAETFTEQGVEAISEITPITRKDGSGIVQNLTVHTDLYGF